MFVNSTGPMREHAHVHHRLGDAELDESPGEEHRRQARSPTVRAEPQPHESPSVRASSSETSAAREGAARRGRRPRDSVLTGDSGTKTCTSAAARADQDRAAMKIQRHESWSTSRPESTSAEAAAHAEHRGDQTDRRADLRRGELVADDREAEREAAPPTPCSARQAISAQMLPANDAPTQPTKNTERLISSTRSLPYWSPSLPSSGVETAEVSRKAVKSQPPRPSSCAGRAGRPAGPGSPSSAARRRRRRRT